MNPKKILLVEDEKALSNVLTLKLDSAGYKTTVAYDGEQALEEIGKQQFDLIILDLIMPKKDGFAVLGELGKMGNIIPIIVLSNLGQEEDLKRAKALGAADYFIKSDSPLTEIIEKVELIIPKSID